MTAFFDDHGQSQGNCGVWNNFSLRIGTREIQSSEITGGRGETLEHDNETFLEKLLFFTYGAREIQSSNLQHCQNQELQGTIDDKPRVQPQGNYRFSEGL